MTFGTSDVSLGAPKTNLELLSSRVRMARHDRLGSSSQACDALAEDDVPVVEYEHISDMDEDSEEDSDVDSSE
ncbi:unnamed protein product [Schistocephalus solidus]|uniref:Uncharacterized protein n=1 Tax=Schistocephalus solidus TaxID=70667 RepID=A0A183TBP4_SCHSO|nr:unnamed protein product [Schistocephalus solidus]